MDKIDFMDVVEVTKKVPIKVSRDRLALQGVFTLTHKDKDGNVISVEEYPNLITNEGKNYALDAALGNDTSVANWYFAIFTSGSAAVSNTYATPNRTEATTAVNEANRQEWAEGAASSQSITNATAATITANGALSVTGIGVVGSPSNDADADTKGDTSSCTDCVLFADVDVTKSLADTETLDITYTVNA
jgi:hypothetical protein